MTDIAPELLQKLRDAFKEKYNNNARIQKILKIAEPTQQDVALYARLTGGTLSDVLHENLSSADLPDGKMYYNIAEKVLQPMLVDNYSMTADICETACAAENKKAGIGIKAQRPDLNQDKIHGILQKAADADLYDDVKSTVENAAVNFTQTVVDDAVRKNADFQTRAGLAPKIIRRAAPGACKWCRKIAGTYNYIDVANTGNDVFRRHENCNCFCEYEAGRKIQNVWSKKLSQDENDDKIKKRRNVSAEQPQTIFPINPETGKRYQPRDIQFSEKQYGKKNGKHCADWGLDPASDKDREKLKEIVNDIVNNADERFYSTWAGQTPPVLFHIKGNDVVLENDEIGFITVMKGGANSEGIKRARKRSKANQLLRDSTK